MTKNQPLVVPEEMIPVSMNIFQANLHTEEDFLEAPQPIKEFNLELAVDQGYDFEEKLVRIRLHFSIQGLNESFEQLGVLVQYGIEFVFKVNNFESFLLEEEGEKKINVLLPGTLIGIAYSTARGILFERTRGTYFNGVVLPVIDPMKLVQK